MIKLSLNQKTYENPISEPIYIPGQTGLVVVGTLQSEPANLQLKFIVTEGETISQQEIFAAVDKYMEEFIVRVERELNNDN